MKKWMCVALGLAALSLWIGSADAAINYTVLKADTLAKYARDSSAVVPMEGVERAWLDISMRPRRPGADFYYFPACDTTWSHHLDEAHHATHVVWLSGGQSWSLKMIDSIGAAQSLNADSLAYYATYTSVHLKFASDSIAAVDKAARISLAVQAREVMTSYSGTDSTYASRLTAQAANTAPAYTANRLYITERSTAAAYSDSTVIPWFPRSNAVVMAVAGVGQDTSSVNNTQPGNAAIGSSEQAAYILPNVGAWTNLRSVRVEFINPTTGQPFRAKFASFRWRMIEGPDIARFRVVLGTYTP
jgi:hypothetical protein